MSSSQIAISATSLSKRYEIYDRPHDRLLQMLARGRRQYFREFWALKDVSFEVRAGETIGIVGKNGSGKSTLLQLLCGTLTPTSGSVTVSGRVAALLELGAGFSPDFSGRENVFLAAKLLGLRQREVEDRFDKIAAFADIGSFLDQPVKTYSSGMFVRLAFAVVAHVDAEILIIDEALAVGDAFFTQKCMRFLREFRQRGTLLFVSHDSSAVTGLCDTALWLDQGRLVDKAPAKAITEKYLESLYQQANGLPKDTATGKKLDRLSFAGSRIVNDAPKQVGDFFFSDFTDSAAFGEGGARVVNVQFCDGDDRVVRSSSAGDVVRLAIEVLATDRLDAPIIGFSLKDRLGQVLFGANSYPSTKGQDVQVEAGKKVRAEFTFQLPVLPAGEYSLAVAVATGTQEHHVQHHWIHDAMIIKAASNSATGLVGLAMQRVELAFGG